MTAELSGNTLHDEIQELRNVLQEKGPQLTSSVATQGKSLLGLDSGFKPYLVDKQNTAKSLRSYLNQVLDSLERKADGKLLEEAQAAECAEAEAEAATQVDTLTGDHDASVQVKTLQISESEGAPAITLSEAEEPEEATVTGPTLTREDIYTQELERALDLTKEHLQELQDGLSNQAVSQEALVKFLAVAQSKADHVCHLKRLLMEERGGESPAAPDLPEVLENLKELEAKVRESGQKAREASPPLSKRPISCPVCTPSQRGSWDSTLWRLEQWLSHAEGNLKSAMKKRPPSDVEQLEDAILRHRELVLDLDSHRALVTSLTKVLSHLREHEGTDEPVGLESLRKRVELALKQWKTVCHNSAVWQARLQIALMENSSFHQNVAQYEELLSQVQDSIKSLEPVDLSQSQKIVRAKYRRFLSMRDLLTRTEPEVATLLATAEQLFVNPTAIEKEGAVLPGPSSSDVFVGEESAAILERITHVNRQLRALQQVCDAYVRHLSQFVKEDEESIALARSLSPVLSFSEEVRPFISSFISLLVLCTPKKLSF